MTEEALLARVCHTIQHYLALGNESFEAHAATFIRNRATPSRYDANHVGLIRTNDPAGIDAMIQQADTEYEAWAIAGSTSTP